MNPFTRLFMGLFSGLRASLTGSYWWHVAELNRLRNSILLGVILPFILMIIATFLGGWWSWGAKANVLTVAMTAQGVALVWLGLRRFIIGTEIELAFNWRGGPALAAEKYVRLLSAVIASGIASGFIMLVIPAHVNPTLSALLIPATMGGLTYAIWKAGVEWWPKMVWGSVVAVFAIVIPLLWLQLVFDAVPLTAAALNQVPAQVAVEGTPISPTATNAIDQSLAYRILSSSAGQKAFNIVFMALVAIRLISYFSGKPGLWFGTKSLVFALMFMFLTNWFVWGGGPSAIGEFAWNQIPIARRISLDWCNERLRAALDGEWVECKFGLNPGEEAGPLIVVKGDAEVCFDETEHGFHELFCITTRGERFRGIPDESHVCVADLRLRTYNPRRYNYVVHKGVLTGKPISLCEGRPIF